MSEEIVTISKEKLKLIEKKEKAFDEIVDEFYFTIEFWGNLSSLDPEDCQRLKLIIDKALQ